jgi:hypothetical protein
MTKPLQALLWALSILFVALLAESARIDSAAVLLVVLPVLAVLSLRTPGARCAWRAA